jgi:hypothetical protein
MRPRLRWCLLVLLALGQNQGHAGQPEPERLRQRALDGRIGWSTYLSHLSRARPSVFQQGQLRRNSPTRYRILVENREQQFAILRDRKALHRVEHRGEVEAEHLLGIPIACGRQPMWLSTVAPGQARLVGRITRETLEQPRTLHRRDAQTLVYYHLPGNISQPIVHAHGVWRPPSKPRVRRWSSFLRRNYRPLGQPGAAYTLYRARPDARGLAAEWPIVAVASTKAGKASQLSPQTDELLGRMLLDVAGSTLKLAPPTALAQGRIEVDRADSRIVVRLVRRRQPSDLFYW